MVVSPLRPNPPITQETIESLPKIVEGSADGFPRRRALWCSGSRARKLAELRFDPSGARTEQSSGQIVNPLLFAA
jgi:hypothetical protein